MAAPVDAGRLGSNLSTAGTSFPISIGSPAAGTLLVILVRFATGPGSYTLTGYTQLAVDVSDASDDVTVVFYRWCDGTEGATVTLTTTSSVKAAAICWRVTGADNPATSAPVVSTVAIGTTTANTANPGSAVPAGQPRDALYIAMMGIDGAAKVPTAAPTNYTNLITAASTGGATATNACVGGASRALTASASDDPPVFTHPAANAGWAAYTVAIRANSGVALSLGPVDGLADTAALADVLTPVTDYPVALADVIGFGGTLPASSLYPSASLYPSGGDLLDIVVGSGVALTLTPSDTLTLVDAAPIWVQDFGLQASDTLPLLDALGVDDSLVLADTVGLLDGLTLDLPGNLTLDLVDVVALADQLTYVWAYGLDLADAVSPFDVLAFDQGHVLGLSDTIALADSLTSGFDLTLVLSDSLSLADGLSIDMQRQWLIPFPEDSVNGVPAAEGSLVLTASAEGTRTLAPFGSDVPLVTSLPENPLALTPIPEGEH